MAKPTDPTRTGIDNQRYSHRAQSLHAANITSKVLRTTPSPNTRTRTWLTPGRPTNIPSAAISSPSPTPLLFLQRRDGRGIKTQPIVRTGNNGPKTSSRHNLARDPGTQTSSQEPSPSEQIAPQPVPIQAHGSHEAHRLSSLNTKSSPNPYRHSLPSTTLYARATAPPSPSALPGPSTRQSAYTKTTQCLPACVSGRLKQSTTHLDAPAPEPPRDGHFRSAFAHWAHMSRTAWFAAQEKESRREAPPSDARRGIVHRLVSPCCAQVKHALAV